MKSEVEVPGLFLLFASFINLFLFLNLLPTSRTRENALAMVAFSGPAPLNGRKYLSMLLDY